MRNVVGSLKDNKDAFNLTKKAILSLSLSQFKKEDI